MTCTCLLYLTRDTERLISGTKFPASITPASFRNQNRFGAFKLSAAAADTQYRTYYLFLSDIEMRSLSMLWFSSINTILQSPFLSL